MHVPFALKVPVGLATEIKDIVEELGGQGNVITLHNYLRAALRVGHEALKRRDKDAVVIEMNKDPVLRGRPRGR